MLEQTTAGAWAWGSARTNNARSRASIARYSSTAVGSRLAVRGSRLVVRPSTSKPQPGHPGLRPESQVARSEPRPIWSNCPVLSPGQVLDDRYEILALLAEGGMGAVYRARRTLLGDEVAIKIVRGEHSGSGPRDRFFRESRAARGCAILISFQFSTSTWTMRIIPFW